VLASKAWGRSHRFAGEPWQQQQKEINLEGDPDNLFTVRELMPGAKAAGPVADSGCKLQWPA
jgi:hypothetical protein